VQRKNRRPPKEKRKEGFPFPAAYQGGKREEVLNKRSGVVDFFQLVPVTGEDRRFQGGNRKKGTLRSVTKKWESNVFKTGELFFGRGPLKLGEEVSGGKEEEGRGTN